MSKQNGYVQFVNDDNGYLRWVRDNPDGLVVNSNRVPVSNYLVLHRASCKAINNPNRGNWTTTGYIKTCSKNVNELSNWATEATGGSLKACGSCRPTIDTGTESESARHASVERTPVAAVSANVAPGMGQQPGRRSVPASISTGCPELDRAWRTYASMILDRSQILIPDTDDDLTWHAFLGHSIDMQGFRAAEFAGVDPLTRHAPGFVPLKRRGIGVPELAALWDIREIQDHFRKPTKDVPLNQTLNVLRSFGGGVRASVVEAFDHFPWRKFHWSVRALLQNSAVLKPFGFSFRNWLRDECNRLGTRSFPPGEFRQTVVLEGASATLERALRTRLERTFYMVGPAMSAYMLCDWQLWLWRESRTKVFANFKLDSFHQAFVKKFGRGVIPADETGFARWWLGLFPELPPRLANECIWLAIENKQVDPW